MSALNNQKNHLKAIFKLFLERKDNDVTEKTLDISKLLFVFVFLKKQI